MALELTKIPTVLHKLPFKIRNSQISGEISRLTPLGKDCVHSFVCAFVNEGNAVLKQHATLLRIKCPRKVNVECLTTSLRSFRDAIQKGYDKAVKLRTAIHYAVESSKEEKRKEEYHIKEEKRQIITLERHIRMKDIEIEEYEKKAKAIERGAHELEKRAFSLRVQSQRHRKNGFAWSFFSFGVGFLFSPFTGGASLVFALASAGIGAKINYDSAEDCDRNANVMRMRANDKRKEAERQRRKKEDFETEKRKKRVEIQDRQRSIRALSETTSTLAELEGYLYRSIKAVEQTTRIVQGFERALHVAQLQGDSFELWQEYFNEDPNECHAETYAEMNNLKEKWRELKRLILSYSDHRGIAF